MERLFEYRCRNRRSCRSRARSALYSFLGFLTLEPRHQGLSQSPLLPPSILLRAGQCIGDCSRSLPIGCCAASFLAGLPPAEAISRRDCRVAHRGWLAQRGTASAGSAGEPWGGRDRGRRRRIGARGGREPQEEREGQQRRRRGWEEEQGQRHQRSGGNRTWVPSHLYLALAIRPRPSHF